ncbi:MAG: hypothetical protein LBM38_04230, partial [Clostridiales bacterium]|nr:hypothetical protein [Clostridiales bacterium]
MKTESKKVEKTTKNAAKNSKPKTVYLTNIAILIAIEIAFCFTALGSLPITPGIVATLAHLPAIVAVLLLD